MAAIAFHGIRRTDRIVLFARKAPIIVACYYVCRGIMALSRTNTDAMPRFLELWTQRMPLRFRASAGDPLT